MNQLSAHKLRVTLIWKPLDMSNGLGILKLLIISRKVLCLMHALRFLMLDSHCAALCLQFLSWNIRRELTQDPNTKPNRLYITWTPFHLFSVIKSVYDPSCLCVWLMPVLSSPAMCPCRSPVPECCRIFQFLCGIQAMSGLRPCL